MKLAPDGQADSNALKSIQNLVEVWKGGNFIILINIIILIIIYLF